jgi:hypothetical protein
VDDLARPCQEYAYVNEFGLPVQPVVLAVNVVPTAPEVGETDTVPPDGGTSISVHIA